MLFLANLELLLFIASTSDDLEVKVTFFAGGFSLSPCFFAIWM
jgi:hypothetical protein